MKNYKIDFSWFPLIIVPVFSFLWHFENKHLPISDPVEYLDAAYSIFLYYENNDFIGFFLSIFNERGWRPIIFQVFLVPFLIISSGNLLVSILLTHVFFNTLAAVFTFKIASTYLNKIQSIITSLIVCLSFNIFFGGETMPLFSEIAFLPFLLGTLYFLIDDKLFSNKNKTRWFTLFFTLTFLTRPVEAFIFILPTLILLSSLRYKLYINIYDMVKGFTYLLFFSWLLFISRIIPNVSSSVIKVDPPQSLEIFIILTSIVTIIFFSMLALLIFIKNNNKFAKTYKRNYFARSMFISGISLWIWYTIRFGSLYGWVYSTSLGEQFSYLKNNYSSNFIELLNSAISNNGQAIIYLSLSLYVFGLAINVLSSRKILDYASISEKLKNLYIVVIAAVPLPVILYFFTFQSSYRKISPVLVILLIFILIKVFMNKNLIKLKTVLLSIFLLVQMYVLQEHIYLYDKKERYVNEATELSKNMLGLGFPHPIKNIDNPYENLITLFKSYENKDLYKNLTLVIGDEDYPIERYLMNFLCKKNSLNCKLLSTEKFEENIKDFNEKNDAYFLVFHKLKGPIISEENANYLSDKLTLYENKRSPLELFSFYFKYVTASNNLAIHKLKKYDCREFYKKFVGCLILRE